MGLCTLNKIAFVKSSLGRYKQAQIAYIKIPKR